MCTYFWLLHFFDTLMAGERWANRNDLKGLLSNRNPCKNTHIAYHIRPWTQAQIIDRELQATMDSNKGARITATIRDVGSVIGSGRRTVGPKTSRVPQTSQNRELELRDEPSSRGTSYRGFTRPAHTHRRPKYMRWLSSVTSVDRLHCEARGGICGVNGDL